jgi:hypothetical protein
MGADIVMESIAQVTLAAVGRFGVTCAIADYANQPRRWRIPVLSGRKQSPFKRKNLHMVTKDVLQGLE